MQQGPHLDQLGAWCAQWLGAAPAAVLFEAGHLSHVVGLRLADGREVVVKARPPAVRLAACVRVQRHIWRAGFPCPRPLAGPAPLGSLAATAETLIPGGVGLGPAPEAPRLFAETLAWLVGLAPPVAALPTLAPPPAWVWWDHQQPGVWPVPDDRAMDLNAPPGPAWLEEVGRRVRARLGRHDAAEIVGHLDWESQNLRWLDGSLHVAHDWDSVAARPEAVIAGTAAAVFPATGAPGAAATVEETESFLAAYERARARPWSADEREVCWAAGLWVRAFNARKAAEVAGGELELDRLSSEAPERLGRAGA